MFGHVQQTVDRYLELALKTKDLFEKVATPCIDDHLIPAEEFDVKGELSAIAARVVLKALYVARIVRLDVVWSVTRRTAACDRRLHRLISFVHHTTEWAQIRYAGDSHSQCWLELFQMLALPGLLGILSPRRAGFYASSVLTLMFL